jgi:hypothetical protein
MLDQDRVGRHFALKAIIAAPLVIARTENFFPSRSMISISRSESRFRRRWRRHYTQVVIFIFREASPRVVLMPDPLPSDIVARLRSDSTAALAASLILAGSFPDIVSWALRAFSIKDSGPKVSVPPDRDAKSRHAPKPKPAAKSDQALLAVMRANPGASLADLIRLGRRPRTSTVASLKRLDEAGLVKHPSKGVYTVVEEAAPPKPAWVEPLSGAHVARHAADGRIRDEMTTA